MKYRMKAGHFHRRADGSRWLPGEAKVPTPGELRAIGYKLDPVVVAPKTPTVVGERLESVPGVQGQESQGEGSEASRNPGEEGEEGEGEAGEEGSLNIAQYAAGGGVYHLPGGEIVRGRTKASKRLQEILSEHKD